MKLGKENFAVNCSLGENLFLGREVRLDPWKSCLAREIKKYLRLFFHSELESERERLDIWQVSPWNGARVTSIGGTPGVLKPRRKCTFVLSLIHTTLAEFRFWAHSCTIKIAEKRGFHSGEKISHICLLLCPTCSSNCKILVFQVNFFGKGKYLCSTEEIFSSVL